MDNRTKNYVEVDGNVLPGSLRGVIELFDEIVETIKGLKPGERKVVYFELVENKSLDLPGGTIAIALHSESSVSVVVNDDGSDEYKNFQKRVSQKLVRGRSGQTRVFHNVLRRNGTPF